MNDDLDTYRRRVEQARRSGVMNDYVDDMSALLRIIDDQHLRIVFQDLMISKYVSSVISARQSLVLMKMQADARDTLDTSALDFRLMLMGAERIALAFDEGE